MLYRIIDDIELRLRSATDGDEAALRDSAIRRRTNITRALDPVPGTTGIDITLGMCAAALDGFFHAAEAVLRLVSASRSPTLPAVPTRFTITLGLAQLARWNEALPPGELSALAPLAHVAFLMDALYRDRLAAARLTSSVLELFMSPSEIELANRLLAGHVRLKAMENVELQAPGSSLLSQIEGIVASPLATRDDRNDTPVRQGCPGCGGRGEVPTGRDSVPGLSCAPCDGTGLVERY